VNTNASYPILSLSLDSYTGIAMAVIAIAMLIANARSGGKVFSLTLIVVFAVFALASYAIGMAESHAIRLLSIPMILLLIIAFVREEVVRRTRPRAGWHW
jgi:hypothetical protein